jgi:hypothetical protein
VTLSHASFTPLICGSTKYRTAIAPRTKTTNTIVRWRVMTTRGISSSW